MALNAGDIVFVGWDADNNDVAFITSTTISAGEVIYFTDTEWNGTAFVPGEQVIEWTVTSDIPPGQVVTIDMTPRGQGGPDADIVQGTSPGGAPIGSVSYLRGGGALSRSDEQFWAVQGSYNGTTIDPDPNGFISVISNEDAGAPGGPNLSGTGLDASNGAITIGGDEDFMIFNPTTALNNNTYTESPEVLRDQLVGLVGDPNNWDTLDGGGNQNPGGGFTYDTGGFSGLPTPISAAQDVTTLYFTGDQVAFVDAIDDTGSSTRLQSSFTFLPTDVIEIDIVSSDIQSGALDGEFDYDQVIFTRITVIRDGVSYDLIVNPGSKVKETGGADSGTKEQGDSFFTTADDVELPNALEPPGSDIKGTLAFSLDEKFIDSNGNPLNPVIDRSRPDLDTNGDGSQDNNTPFNNENFNVGTVLTPPIIPCFVEGTRIKSKQGQIRVEDLAVGDWIETLDNGFQAIRWIGRVSVAAKGKYAPIVISKDALGNEEVLRVSPEHRVLLSGWRAELLFGLEECLVAAKFLCNGDTIYRETNWDTVDYYHILFDRHEIVSSCGIWTESYFLDLSRREIPAHPVEQELMELFPDMPNEATEMSTVRPILRAFEGRVLDFGR